MLEKTTKNIDPTIKELIKETKVSSKNANSDDAGTVVVKSDEQGVKNGPIDNEFLLETGLVVPALLTAGTIFYVLSRQEYKDIFGSYLIIVRVSAVGAVFLLYKNQAWLSNELWNFFDWLWGAPLPPEAPMEATKTLTNNIPSTDACMEDGGSVGSSLNGSPTASKKDELPKDDSLYTLLLCSVGLLATAILITAIGKWD